MENNNKEFRPYIPAESNAAEFTITSIVLGVLLAVVFGGANAYLGLRVGMTISASIPAAVVSMGIIRMILKRDSILENNIVQTIGSAGEAVAGGAIFTLPVLFMWATEGFTEMPSALELTILCICGGVLGVAFMIPLRESLIVQEHGTLPYPEGTACAEVLIAGEEGGEKSKMVFKGLGLAAIYKFISDGLHVFPSEVHWDIAAYKGSAFGMDVLPALGGVGYICGVKVSSSMFCGGILAWFVIMPLIATFGTDLILYPATVSVAEVVASGGAYALWSNYVRYIGAGAVVGGGFITMIKTIPMLVNIFKQTVAQMGGTKSTGTKRTDLTISMKVVGIIVLAVSVIMVAVPMIPVNFVGLLIILILGFVFAAATSRIVGLVGCNNSPVSSMTIATLMITCLVFKSTGYTSPAGYTAAIAIACVICVTIAVASDTSQDLKTGFLVGATPKKQQAAEMIGALAASLAIGGILYLLHVSYGFGSAALPAPQAVLMKMVVEGVMGGQIPWTLIIIGIFISIMAQFLGLSILPFAIGLYLPIHLSMGIMAGGVVRWLVDRKKYQSEEEHKEVVERGVLYTSGLIAGEGVVGILLAVCAILPVGEGTLSDVINLSGTINIGQIGGVICFILVLLTIFKVTIWRKNK